MHDVNPSDTMHRVDIIEDWKEIECFCRSKRYTLSRFFAVVWSITLHRYFERDIVYFALNDDALQGYSADGNEQDGIYQGAMSVDATINNLFESPAIISLVPDFPEDEYGNQTGLWLVPEQLELPPPSSSLPPSLGKCQVMLVVRVRSGTATLELHHGSHDQLRYQGQHLASAAAQVARKLPANQGGKVRDIELVDMGGMMKWCHQRRKECIEPCQQTFVEVLHQRRRENPDALALCAWDGELTYGQLDVLTDRVAGHLRRQGVGIGALVPICFEKSIYAIVSKLAILKAGGAFVPMDPAHPEPFLRQILEQTKATMIVTSTALTQRMSEFGLPVITCYKDIVSGNYPDEGELGPVALPDTQHPAFVVFSSGSTGRPSGCVISHASLADVAGQVQAVHLTTNSRVLQFASYTFAVSVIQIFCTLAAGATVCTPSEEECRDRLTDCIHEMRVNWALLTPSTLNAIHDPSLLPSLKTLVLAGEPIGRHHVRTWADHVELLEVYGFSEWSGYVAVTPRLTTDPAISGRAHSAGLSPSTATLWLADPVDHNRPMPFGAVAELLVDGPGLAQGYLGDSTKTAQRFIDSPPWIPGHGRRVYKTGDLVQYLPDGSFRYIARKDTQVKIRGMRLDLVDMEHCIYQQCPSVNRAVAEAVVPQGSDAASVLAVFLYYVNESTGEDDRGGEGTGAMFDAHDSWRTQFKLDASHLKTELPQSLPQHMIPGICLPLRYLPLTITGKVDRRRIRETIRNISWFQLQTYAMQKVELVLPKTNAEVTLHGLFAQVLDIHPQTFGVHDSFLHHGGDSLKAMRLVHLCRQHGLSSITFQDIMERQTVQQLVSARDDTSEESSSSSVEPGLTAAIEPDHYLRQTIAKRLRAFRLPEDTEIESIFPCSHVQEGILVSQARHPSHYQIRSNYSITPTAHNNQSINVGQLMHAWKQLIRVHPMLRTIFIESTVPGLLALQVVLGEKVCESSIMQCKSLSSGLPFGHEENSQLPTPMWPSLPRVAIKQDSTGLFSIVLSISHAVTDATSLSIMMRDLNRLYNRETEGGASVLPPRLLYLDYIIHLRQNMKPSSLEFWTSYLADVEPCLFPPMNTHHHHVGNFSHWQRLPIQLEDASRYHQFCSITGITIASILKLAWGLTLRSFTASNKVCFGYMTSGRDLALAGIENALGPFINNLPCALNIRSETPLLQMLRELQDDFTKALPYQRVSMAAVQHSLGLAGESALFNTSITFPPQLQGEEGSQIQITEQDRWDPTEDDIVVEVTSQDKKVGAELKYWTRTLSESQAGNVANTLSRVLSQIINTPQKKPCDMQLISFEDETHIRRLNSTLPPSNEVCVHTLIDRQCEEHPVAEAVCSWDGAISYKELQELSTQLAFELINRGVKRGTYVPLCLSRSYWTPVAMLAVMKAGAAFCLLELSHPQQRLRWICELLQLPIIITSTEHRDFAEQLGGKEVLCVDKRTKANPNRTHCPNLQTSVDPNDALFVVFTSGSTGKPKGIIIENRSYATNAFEHARLLGLSNKSRMLQMSGYAFDAAVLEHLTVLLTGGCVCIPSESERFNNPVEVAARMKVDAILTTPSVARVLRLDEIPSLKTLGLCGEAMDQADIERWTPMVRLANVYGPAECTVISTIQPSQQGKHPRNIGLPIAFSAWITMPDDPRQLLPVGTVGELLIEGPIVGRGYIGNTDQAATNFMAPPAWLRAFRGKSFRPEKSRLYRTGDLVYYDVNDSSLQFVGRKDTQIKLRGQRIELSEVQHHLRSHLPCARNIIVDMVRREQSASLVAFILPDATLETEPAHESTESIFAHPSRAFQRATASALSQLQRDLPPYMVPAAVVPLSELPLTKTGKIDRRRLVQEMSQLPDDAFQRLKGGALGPKAPPSTDRELQLQQIWASTLSIPSEQVGVKDRFFSIGGDSVSAIQTVACCRSSGLLVSAADMMQNPTIAELAPRVETIAEEAQMEHTIAPFTLVDNSDGRNAIFESVERLCGIDPGRVEDAYPCTSLQEGLIALTARTKTAYVAEWKFHLPAEIDLNRLEAAWKATVAANAILRTRIIQLPGDNRCYQVVIREEGSWEVYQDAETCNRAMKQELGLNQPLVQVAAVVVGESQSSLILRLHHSVYDGWSLPLLLEQVQQAYDGEELASHSMKPFIAYVQEQHSRASQWWKSELAGLTTTVFPPLPSPDYQPTPDSTLTRSIHTGQMASGDFSLATKLRLAYALVVSQYTGSHDVVFGITNSGRAAPVPGIDKLTGPTNATVPQRVALVLRSTVRESLQQMQDSNARLVPHEQFGLQNIAQCGDSHAAACGFQTLLVIQPPRKEYRGPLFSDGVSLTDLSAFTGYLLMLECQLSNDAIEVRAGFDSGAVSRTRVEQILRQFDHVLGQINKPGTLDTQLSHLDLIHPEDAAQLVSWNSPKGDVLPERCVHHAIQEHCDKQPDAPAVCAWDGDFTYRALDQFSSGLAENLWSCGVRPETVVPIYSEKSRWVTVAILGVVKAGGAFVLLAPTHPFERLQQICQQASAQVVVASQDYRQLATDLVPGGTVVTVEDSNSLIRSHQQPEKNAAPLVPGAVSPRNLLYVVFTSGSTGQPKGAMIEHRSCYLSAMGLRSRFGMGNHSRTLQFSSHAFDISVWDHIGTLLAGGCVCIPSETQRKNRLAQVTTEMQVNVAILTPSVVHTLGGPRMVPTLRTLVLAGEMISRDDISTWSAKVRLVNGYGPAECAGITTVQPINGEHNDPRNVGRPNDRFSIWITHPDDSDKLSPVGAVGEIVVEGPTVGRGYLNDAERSAASFIPTPPWLQRLRGESAAVPNGHLYKTGDMGQYQPDASILFLGRRDGQVKIRGQRVELSEVEHHVSRQFEGTPEVFALVIEHGQRQTLVALVAWLDRGSTEDDVARDPTRIFGDRVSQSFRELLPAVRTRLDHTLPPYMVPAVFLPLAWVPLTKSGKVDRRLLRQRVSRFSTRELEAFGGGDRPHRAPTSRAEQVLQLIFARTLSIDPQSVSADDQFFKIGGDSITAMKMVGEARRGGISITVSDIFLNPVLSALAKVDKIDSVTQHSSISLYSSGRLLDIVDITAFASSLANLPPPFTPEDVADILPTTAFQTNCLEGGHILYHWLQLPQSVEMWRLEAACRALVQHHAIFRTLFIPHGNQYLQVILHDPHFSIIHLTCEDNIHGFTESMCRQDCTRAKTLGHPLFQIYLISQSRSRHRRLVIRLTHAQYDGTSLGQALKDLSIAYDGNPLQSLVPSFAQYLHYKKLTRFSETRPFWQNYLCGSRMTDLESIIESNDERLSNADEQTISVEREIPLPSNQEGIPVAFLAQATWAFILAQLTGDRDIVFGFVSQSRNAPLPHMDQISGPCSNIVPTRITIDPVWTVGELVNHVKDQFIRMVPHATMDLKEIQPLIPEWSPSTRFGSVFNHINMNILSAPRLGGIECQQGVVSPGGAAAFLRGYSKFLVRTTLRNDKLGIYMSGWEKRMSSDFVHDLMDRFVTTISEFSMDYSSPLAL